jgi:SAM-dependent methyltransferase
MTDPSNLDTVGRFNDRAADYVRFRPTYPPEAVQAILDGLGPSERIVATDMGAGTGISARLLGSRGVRVLAIEPGDAMRRAATPHPNVWWVGGRADATGLRRASVDLVLCAQSFHWFQTPDALAEFARILKPHGRLAIVWNSRSEIDPLTVGYRQAILDVGGETALERARFDPEVITGSGLFTAPDRQAFPNIQRLDADGLIGRARSASYVPKTGAAGDRLIALLRALHAQYADVHGLVTLVYETLVYRSTRL